MVDEWPNPGLDLHLELNVTDGLRTGLERALREAVRSGRLATGTRLPATRRLAGDLGLARGTVRAAYDQLIAEGYLAARQGSGTVVALPPQVVPSSSATPAAAERPRHDLRPGSADASAFPVTAWLESTRRALGSAPADAFGYGDPCGRPELRAALAKYLGRARGVSAGPGSIMITNGYMHGLTLLATVIGGTFALEDPGVPTHREAIRRTGAQAVPLPVDDLGARTDLLGGLGADAVEVTPAHQYPTGRTLHPDRRRALLDWARSSGGLIIENDYDAEFRYDRKPVGALQGADPGHVAYLGTTSKTLGAALRIGWMVLPSRLIAPVAEVRRHSDHHTEHLGQLALADLITRHGYDRHIRASRQRYLRRRDQLRRRLIGLPVELTGIAAGLHALALLPPGGPTEADVRAAARAHGLALGYLSERGELPVSRQGVIIGYGRPADHAYPSALTALDATFAACFAGFGHPR
ncbi:PLP-dependent aminotransferase family protein [Spongiactinospora sp. TRM90649]|uniref:MocR-like pyridoxine biosynthesis transcription factor PdxR n=1 Tax=Spongiactinospora sp. TRM90649 TaxID=3031114 RepID=UPI0023FA3338|nr:PLP-dependent aminotransferase family protein [Spongiactinospora sp. TRM90649]MDF5754383.1 PLP-dependent aminotransferase family protein [Spongiactinospora sp. TRM90649]